MHNSETWKTITDHIITQLDGIFENQLDFDDIYTGTAKYDEMNETEEDRYIN